MMREFAVEFGMRKGLGPETVPKTVFVGLDDLEPGMDESDIRAMAIADAETQLRQADDFALYGKTWTFRTIHDA